MRFLIRLFIAAVLAAVVPTASGAPYTFADFRLARIDLRTQTLELIGTQEHRYVWCLEYSEDGFLYGVNVVGYTLIRFDPDTGASETVGPLGVDAGLYVTIDLAEDPGGQLWMLVSGDLYRIDRTTGAATFECQAASPHLRGLAFLDGRMVTSDDDGLPPDPGCGLEYVNVGSASIATGPDSRLYTIWFTNIPWGDPLPALFRFDPITGVEKTMFITRSQLAGLAMSPEQLPPEPIPDLQPAGAAILVGLTAAVALFLLRRRG